MASTFNNYALLEANGEQPAAVAAASKKKKNKKKGGGGQAQITDAAPVVIAAPAAPEPPRAQPAKEAGEALEAAAVAASAGERGPLALEWTEQVLRSDALYADGNDLVDFKQVLLKSRAIDLLLEGCLQQGSAAAEAPALAQLLGAVAHPSVPLHVTQALAQAAASLGQLAATDRLAPTPAAKRAAGAALALARRGLPKPPPAKPAEGPAAKLKRLDGELGRHEARLASTQQPKELCKVYTSILDILCSQLDVLRPGGGGGGASGVAAGPPLAPEVAAALRPMEELRAALNARLQEVQAPPKPVLSISEQVAEAEASHKREDAEMAARAREVEARIASLEAELACLKVEAGDLRQRRSSAAQHHAHRVAQIRSGKPDTGASPADIAAAVQGGLAALEGLAGAVRGGGSEGTGAAGANGAAAADSAVLGQQVVASEVPVKLLGAMQQVVELHLGQLHELGSKARFYRERLDKAVKQGEQAAKLGVGDPKLFKQQREAAEKNVKEVLAAAEAAAAACRSAVSSYRERLPTMLRLPSFLPPPPEYLEAMEGRAGEAQQLLAAIQSNTYVPPPAAPPAAPGGAADGAAPAAAGGAVPAGGAASGDVSALEQRLAALEAENQKKDAQIAAMVGSASLDVPSPLVTRTSMPPAMLSSPSNHKPVGTAAPIAPAAAPAAAGAEPAATPAEAAPAVPPAAPAPAPAPAVVSFSQALASAPPQQQQANGQGNSRRPRPRRA